MRRLILLVMLLPLASCDKTPARLAAGIADTVIVNNRRSVPLPIHVLDARGNVLPNTGVRYQWTSGMPIPVSTTGVVTCTQPGDATVHASLGSLAAQLILRCRPVIDVHAVRMMNLVVGGPPQELPFEAVGLDGQPVTLLAGNVTVLDSTVATVEGVSVRARAGGSTGLTMRIGDRNAFASVHGYDRASPASRELYYVTILPDRDDLEMPRLAIMGANCKPALDAHNFFCIAQHDASVIVYHPREIDSAVVLSGMLAVWRQSWP